MGHSFTLGEGVRRRQLQQKKILNLPRAMAAMNVPQKSFLKFDGVHAYPRVCFFPFLWGVGVQRLVKSSVGSPSLWTLDGEEDRKGSTKDQVLDSTP